MIAVQEARLLWPDQPIDVVVSLGVGSAPVVKREVGLSAFMETGAILIESRWASESAWEGSEDGVCLLLCHIARLIQFAWAE